VRYFRSRSQPADHSAGGVCLSGRPWQRCRFERVPFDQSLMMIILPFVVAAQAALTAPYPAMAPVERYLMPDQQSEIALARTAAPASISDDAEVMVLGREGYTTAVRGSNGFLCIVERSWGAATDDPGFWNPSVRAPDLLQSGRRKDHCAHLLGEDHAGALRSFEGGNRAGDRIGARPGKAARARVWRDVLHPVQAAVLGCSGRFPQLAHTGALNKSEPYRVRPVRTKLAEAVDQAGRPARPRKTNAARLKRIMSASASFPIRF
jgi:hypothetical protein